MPESNRKIHAVSPLKSFRRKIAKRTAIHEVEGNVSGIRLPPWGVTGMLFREIVGWDFKETIASIVVSVAAQQAAITPFFDRRDGNTCEFRDFYCSQHPDCP